nr:helix-turn-helix domain-containing protein [Bacillus cereus]
MVNTQKLKGLIVERGTTQQAVANAIGMDRSTFYRKMKKGGVFTIEEAGSIAEEVPLTMEEATEIFFGSLVAKTQQENKREVG